MNSEHKGMIEWQFSRCAEFYADSPVHSDSYSLSKLISLSKPKKTDLALDIATGAGHTAHAIAPYVDKVIAVDMSHKMLEVSKKLANLRRISNIEFIHCDAESLIFKDDTFNIVTSRIAPHHFPNKKKFVLETYRVLKKNGKFIVADTWVPENKEIDIFMNKIEKIRDSTHYRSSTKKEWEDFLLKAGYNIKYIKCGCLAKERSFNHWVEISGTNNKDIEKIRNLLIYSNINIKEYLSIRYINNDIFFQIPRIVFCAVK